MSVPESPLLSVIVPVAMGREPYTRLFTWLSQSAEHNLEVIVVIDEFSDKAAPEFLNEISDFKSEAFVVLKGIFGSPGGARNLGLKSARGEWVTFWDSDDAPNIPGFLKMVATASAQDAEVAIGSFVWRSDLDPSEVKIYKNPTDFPELIYSIGRTPGIWRFAIKRDLLEQPFSTLRMAEDQEFILSNKYLSHKVFHTKELVYEYFTGNKNHQTSTASNFDDLEIALNFSFQHYSNASSNPNRKLASFFWFQQFGSNLKYGKKSTRRRILALGVKQLIKSDLEFKKSQVGNLFRLFLKQKEANIWPKVIVPLTGGLGNQLFQLSAAMAIAKDSQVGLDSTIGAPRLNSEGQPEIASFELPANVHLLTHAKRSKGIQKASGYLLRIGVSPRNFENFFLYKSFFNLLWNILISLSSRRFIVATAGRGVGYFPLRSRRAHQLIYGYFQSYFWPESSIEQLKSIKPIHYSTELKEYSKLSEIESPLIVHIRLGDYKLENSFGIPSQRYYSEAISQMWQTGEYRKIWVFSDEPNFAAEYLPAEYRAEYRWIPEVDSSTAQTLEVMRFGKGYVIGNSTFSWWAAFLAYNSKVQVIAPRPWFKFGESPAALIPPGWKQIDAFKD